MYVIVNNPNTSMPALGHVWQDFLFPFECRIFIEQYRSSFLFQLDNPPLVGLCLITEVYEIVSLLVFSFMSSFMCSKPIFMWDLSVSFIDLLLVRITNYSKTSWFLFRLPVLMRPRPLLRFNILTYFYFSKKDLKKPQLFPRKCFSNRSFMVVIWLVLIRIAFMHIHTLNFLPLCHIFIQSPFLPID